MALVKDTVKKEPIVKPLSIDAILGRPRNMIARIGVELEGGWKVLPDKVTLERDTSVFGGQAVAGYKTGELPIGPMQPAALAKFMKKYYPHKVDATCGMHVHMSFETVWRYALLMVPEYQETVIEQFTLWAKQEGLPISHCIWDRLAGRSIYCQKKFWPDAQFSYKDKDHNQNRHGHRYTMINYCGRQNTIECRLLPMMQTSEQATRAIRRLLDVTNACLYALAKKEEKFHGNLELSQQEAYNEYIEERL